VDNLEQAKSLHSAHRALFSNSDITTFNGSGVLFSNISVNCKADLKNKSVGEQSKEMFKWFNITLN
jgi:hypothetical protein